VGVIFLAKEEKRQGNVYFVTDLPPTINQRAVSWAETGEVQETCDCRQRPEGTAVCKLSALRRLSPGLFMIPFKTIGLVKSNISLCGRRPIKSQNRPTGRDKVELSQCLTIIIKHYAMKAYGGVDI
jgi:hypothetical protein